MLVFWGFFLYIRYVVGWYKQTKLDSCVLIPEPTSSRRLGLGLCDQPNVKLGMFRSLAGRSNVFNHTEELWYNKSRSVDDLGWFLCLMAHQPL